MRRNRLTRWMPYDSYERHQVVVTLLKGLPVQSVLDVGGRAGLLSRFTSYDVTALNVDGSGDVQYGGGVFPFPDGHFSAVVCIDTLEHLPKGERLGFLRECLRVTERYLIVAAPFGSPGHTDYEKRLNGLYQQVYGRPHIYLNEHVQYGLPDEAELEELSSRMGDVEHRLWFAGDYVWQGKYFERTLLLQRQRGWISRLKTWFNHVFSLALFHPVRLQAQSYPSANRFYLFFEKQP